MHPGFSDYRERLGDFIRRAESLSAVESEAVFQQLALDLFALQFENVAPYRRLCEARGIVPSRTAQWRDIPSVPTPAFKEFELTCLSPEDRTCVLLSSGTTGQSPSRHFHNAASLATYEQSLWPPFRQHLLAAADSTLSLLGLTPSPVQAPHSSLVRMFDAVRRHLGAPASVFVGQAARDGSWELDVNAVGRALAEVESGGQPVLVLGTAFSFIQLLDALPCTDRPSSVPSPRVRRTLPPGSRVLETGGYKGRSRELPKAELHRLLSEHLRVPPSHMVSEYGMSELSSQAYDHVASRTVPPGGRVFRFPPWARAILVSPESGQPVADGETGLIRVFDLANVSSVMAVQTEDLGVRRGDGFELIGRAPQVESRGCSLMAR
jgi:hypothetical protein